jgi:hypothetical protein
VEREMRAPGGSTGRYFTKIRLLFINFFVYLYIMAILLSKYYGTSDLVNIYVRP